MARAGLRRCELCGLRRSDAHLLADSQVLGCGVPRAHLHVERRDNPNGAWAKSRRQRVVPLDSLVVQAFDAYMFERPAVPQAADSDFLMVNLPRAPIGSPKPPDAHPMHHATHQETRCHEGNTIQGVRRPNGVGARRCRRAARGPGEIRIAVRAVGVNAMDWKIRSGQMRDMMPLDLPAGIGLDAAGTVYEIGDGVDGVGLGDAVFGTGTNTYAECLGAGDG